MGLVPQDDIDRRNANAEPVPLPFGEGVAAVFESGRLTDQSFSTHHQTSEALTQSFGRMRDLGIGAPELPWPLTDESANAALSWADFNKDRIAAARAGLEGPPDPFLKTGEEIRQGVKERVEQARAEASRAGMGAQLVGGLGVGLADPLNLAALPLGVASAETLFARVLSEAAIGGASQAGVEIASLGAKERAGVAPTLSESAGNVALTALAGGALGGIFHGLGRAMELRDKVEAYNRGVAEGHIQSTRGTDAARDALQDMVDTVPPLASPAAEAAHLDATVAAIDVVRAEHPVSEAAALARLEGKAAAVAGRESEIARQLAEPTAVERLAVRAEDANANVAALTERLTEAQRAAMQVRGFDPDIKPASASNFALNVARPGLSDALGGVEVTATRIDGGVRLEMAPDPLAPSAPRVLSLFDSDGIAGARAKLDAFTDASGAPNVPPSRREALASEFEGLQADRLKASRAARDAEIHASRRMGDSIGQPGGKPFKTRKAAEQYAAQSRVGPHSIEPSGRGFVVTPENRIEVPGLLAAEADARAVSRETIDAAVAAEKASPTPPTAEPPLVRGEVASSQPVESPDLATFDATVEATPDLRASYTGADGPVGGSARELMAAAREEESFARGLLDCVMGVVKEG